MMREPAWVQISVGGRPLRIEYQWIGTADVNAPLMVFLHEGLGSVAQWRDFPVRLCAAVACRGLVYSRPGYGASTPRAPDETWFPDFMHRQGHEVLPGLLQALGIDAQRNKPWLFGHSDGGSIALLYAARFPDQVAGAVVMAPHILVEDISITGIEAARQAYVHHGMRDKLARFHADPDSAFWGWNQVWLSPAFRRWNISAELPTIRCPLLAIQGLNDEYGTLAQIRGIAAQVPHAELLELPDCGHAPHRDQCDTVMGRVAAFVSAHDDSHQH